MVELVDSFIGPRSDEAAGRALYWQIALFVLRKSLFTRAANLCCSFVAGELGGRVLAEVLWRSVRRFKKTPDALGEYLGLSAEYVHRMPMAELGIGSVAERLAAALSHRLKCWFTWLFVLNACRWDGDVERPVEFDLNVKWNVHTIPDFSLLEWEVLLAEVSEVPKISDQNLDVSCFYVGAARCDWSTVSCDHCDVMGPDPELSTGNKLPPLDQCCMIRETVSTIQSENHARIQRLRTIAIEKGDAALARSITDDFEMRDTFCFGCEGIYPKAVVNAAKRLTWIAVTGEIVKE